MNNAFGENNYKKNIFGQFYINYMKLKWRRSPWWWFNTCSSRHVTIATTETPVREMKQELILVHLHLPVATLHPAVMLSEAPTQNCYFSWQKWLSLGTTADLLEWIMVWNQGHFISGCIEIINNSNISFIHLCICGIM